MSDSRDPLEPPTHFSDLPQAIQAVIAEYANIYSQQIIQTPDEKQPSSIYQGDLYDWADFDERARFALINVVYKQYAADFQKIELKEGPDVPSISEQTARWLDQYDLGAALVELLTPSIKAIYSSFNLSDIQKLLNIPQERYIPLLVSMCDSKSRNTLLKRLCKYNRWQLFTLFLKLHDNINLSPSSCRKVLNYLHNALFQSEMTKIRETQEDSKGDRKDELEISSWSNQKVIHELQNVLRLMSAVKKSGIDIFAEAKRLTSGLGRYVDHNHLNYLQNKYINIDNCYQLIFQQAMQHSAMSLAKEILEDSDFNILPETMKQSFSAVIECLQVDIFELFMAKRQQACEIEKTRAREEKNYQPLDLSINPCFLLPIFKADSHEIAKPFLKYFETKESGLDTIVRSLCTKKLKQRSLIVEQQAYFSAPENTILFLFALEKAGLLASRFVDSPATSLFLKNFFVSKK